MPKIKLIFIFLLLILNFVACSGEKTIHWKQEVQLQDGRVIIMDRDSIQSGNYFPENYSIEKSQAISFINPDTNEKITWEIPGGLNPYMLDFEKGAPYLVLDAYGVGSYNDWGCPNPPFLVYRYESHSWGSVAFENLPDRFEKRNLIDISKEFQRISKNNILTIDEFKQWAKDISKENRIISREKVSSIAQGCNPDTLTKLGRQSEIHYRK